MSPHFAVKQHDDLAKSTDRRKHLNYLLNDYSEENVKIYAGTGRFPNAGSNIRPVRPQQPESPNEATVTWSPDVNEEQASSRQLAAQVNNKRTPSGQFFTTVNPTLYDKQPPPSTYQGSNVTSNVMATRGGSSGMDSVLASPQGLHGGGYGSFQSHPAPVSPAALASAAGGQGQWGTAASLGAGNVQQATATMTHSQPWLCPWQTGDRKTGRAMADAVRSKRTPIGSFANLDLAKASK